MTSFCIVEIDDGMTIVEVAEDETMEEVAEREGGMLVEGGPFASYDEAYDALLNLETLDDPGDERDTSSELPVDKT